MLIDTFVNAIYLYDDKMLITFNYKDGTKTITFDEATTALANKDTGSNLDCLGAPWRVFLQHLKSCEDTRFFLLKQQVCRQLCSSRTLLFWC